MAQAILVMDMPQNCFKCKLQNFATCRIANKCHVGDKRPDWCPLRELPEKKEELSVEEYEFGGLGKAFASGWNACLDEILERKE